MNFKEIIDKIVEKWNTFVSNLFSTSSSNSNSSYKSKENNVQKDTTQTYWNGGTQKKSFWNDGSKFLQGQRNMYANNKSLVKEDFKEVKNRIFSKVINVLIVFVIILLALICALSIYKIGFGLVSQNDISTIGGYSDYLVMEDLMEPTINKYDLVIVKKYDSYSEGDIILYEYATSSHKLGKVKDSNRYYYTVEDRSTGPEGFQTPRETAVGKIIIRLKNFYKIYNTITSPVFVVLLIGIIALYFYLNIKGKVKDE